MPIKERDVRKIIAEARATSWRLCECIWVRELSATHSLGQMRRLRMLEEQKAWKREAIFDRIETITEMREHHFIAGFHSEPLYTKLYNPRWPHTPEQHTLERGSTLSDKIWKLFFRSPRRHRGGCPRSVRGQINPEFCELRVNQ